MPTFVYKVIKTSWGICVSVAGEVAVEAIASLEPQLMKVGGFAMRTELPQTTSDSCSRLPAEDRLAIERGLAIVDKIATPPAGACFLLTLQELSYPLTDYQSEGVTCAVIGLLCSSLGLAIPTVGVHYDKIANRYVFDFSMALSG